MNENELALLSEKFSKGKPLNIFIRVIGAISCLIGLLTIFLPFGKIMYYHPEAFSLLDLPSYEVDNLLFLLAVVIGMASTLILMLSMNWLNCKDVKKMIRLNICAAILCFISLLIIALQGNIALYSVEKYCDFRVDPGIAYYTSYIGIFIPLVLNPVSAITVSLVTSGKVTVDKMFGK